MKNDFHLFKNIFVVIDQKISVLSRNVVEIVLVPNENDSTNSGRNVSYVQ